MEKFKTKSLDQVQSRLIDINNDLHKQQDKIWELYKILSDIVENIESDKPMQALQLAKEELKNRFK